MILTESTPVSSNMKTKTTSNREVYWNEVTCKKFHEQLKAHKGEELSVELLNRVQAEAIRPGSRHRNWGREGANWPFHLTKLIGYASSTGSIPVERVLGLTVNVDGQVPISHKKPRGATGAAKPTEVELPVVSTSATETTPPTPMMTPEQTTYTRVMNLLSEYFGPSYKADRSDNQILDAMFQAHRRSEVKEPNTPEPTPSMSRVSRVSVLLIGFLPSQAARIQTRIDEAFKANSNRIRITYTTFKPEEVKNETQLRDINLVSSYLDHPRWNRFKKFCESNGRSWRMFVTATDKLIAEWACRRITSRTSIWCDSRAFT